MYNILAIDPGISGALAWQVGCQQFWCKMPATNRDLMNKLNEITAANKPAWLAFVEKIQAMPKVMRGTTGAFTFGCNYGALLMGLEACTVPVTLVLPRKWMSALGLVGKAADKYGTLRHAQRRFPSVDAPIYAADALCILDYGLRTTTGTEPDLDEEEILGFRL